MVQIVIETTNSLEGGQEESFLLELQGELAIEGFNEFDSIHLGNFEYAENVPLTACNYYLL